MPEQPSSNPARRLRPVPRPVFKHEHYCTHIRHAEDHDILRRQLFDVNMRFFRINKRYRAMVLGICEYIAWNAATPKDGYKVPHGFSGANGGIPFNIIAVKRRINGAMTVQVMINPKITRAHGRKIVGESNCGSLTLSAPLKVQRDEFIDFNYYNISGEHVVETNCTREKGGLTIQHEVDHNMGILITDRVPPSTGGTTVPLMP